MRALSGIAALFHHRWSAPILAELHRREGERYAYLAHRFGISRETLSQTLSYLIRKGWVKRNPGYGHPLRPEYLLTARGERLGDICAGLDDLLSQQSIAELGLRKWTMPIMHALAEISQPARFSQILLSLKSLTPRALSESLKRMEEAGWIVREVTNDFPPSTRYAVTAAGRPYQSLVVSLAKTIRELTQSGSK